MKTNAFYLTIVIISQVIWLNAQSVEDIEGNSYKTITYRSKVWMAENLRTQKLNDGTPIPVVEDLDEWENLKTPALCWYNNNIYIYEEVFGGLYNWYAVSTNKLCPTGWRVPNKAEWEDLINSLGGKNAAGGKLKTKGNLVEANGLWYNFNEKNTNDIGFSARPGGGRFSEMNYVSVFTEGYWWTSTDAGIDESAYRINMDYMYPDAYASIAYKIQGLSVRCVKD